MNSPQTPAYGTFDQEEAIVITPAQTEFHSIWPYDLVNSFFRRYYYSPDEHLNNVEEEEEAIPQEAIEVINFVIAMLIALFSMMTFATLLMFIILQTNF